MYVKEQAWALGLRAQDAQHEFAGKHQASLVHAPTKKHLMAPRIAEAMLLDSTGPVANTDEFYVAFVGIQQSC